ncbi:MAG: hypothetical protein QNJ45_15785 [Ardenticatenaceae bacterium]|nr:hypothetical protein [Ardenticatenaceae bacterium]
MITSEKQKTLKNPILSRWLTSGFLLLVPVLIWNALFFSKLPPVYNSDAGVPGWLLVAEGALRLVVFAWPLLLIISWGKGISKVGLILYLTGSLVYYAAWLVQIYAPSSALAGFPLVALAPAWVPLIFMSGIGLMAESWGYVAAVTLFVIAHVGHNLITHGLI